MNPTTPGAPALESDTSRTQAVIDLPCAGIEKAVALAQHARSLELEISEAQRDNARLRDVLVEIANAKGFDNIGNWARNTARAALARK